MLNGTYVEMNHPTVDDSEISLGVSKTPWYWEVMEEGRAFRYAPKVCQEIALNRAAVRLGQGRDKLSLPLSSGERCVIKTVVSAYEEDESVTLLILENTAEVQEALRLFPRREKESENTVPGHPLNV